MCFAHSNFNFQFQCQHEAILFIPRIWSSVFWGGFLFCSSSSFSSCVLWGPISSGMRSGDEVRGEQHGSWVGLSPLYVFCSWRAAIEQGKGLSATPFLGAEGRKRELECCRGSHGKEIINWESFQETSSKWFEALWTTSLVVRLCGVMWTLWIYVSANTHETSSPLSDKSLMLEEKVSWEENSAWWLGTWRHIQPMMFGWLKCGTCGFSILWQASTLYNCLLKAEGPLNVPMDPPKAKEAPVRSSLGVLEHQALAVHHT